MFAYGNMIGYDPTLVGMRINFLVLCTNVNVYLHNFSEWVEPSMNIHEGNSSPII